MRSRVPRGGRHERLELTARKLARSVLRGRGGSNAALLPDRAVFLVGVEEGLLPHRRAIEEEQGREAAPSVALAGELHAAYVGATRPREYLYLTHCRRRDERDPGGGTTTRVCRPSRFLDLLPPGSLARAA